MASADQILLIVELFVYVLLILQVLFRRHMEEPEEYLIAYLGLSAIPSLLWLARLNLPSAPMAPVEIIASWARLVPALAFGAVTLAFVRQPRWALGWLLSGVVLFTVLVALQFGWLPLAPAVGEAFRVVLWALALAGASLALWLSYRRQTSPLHRNRYHYWLVILGLLLVAEGVLLVDGFAGHLVARVLGWAAAGLATYVVLQVHPPELRTLVRRAVRFLALTVILGLVFFGVLIAIQRVNWPSISQREALLLTGVIAGTLAILLPGISRLAGGLLNRLLFESDYDEQEVVRRYSQSVSNILDIDRLASAAFDVVNDVFRLQRGALLLIQYSGGGNSTILPVRALGNVSTQLMEVETFGLLMHRFRQGTPLTHYDVDVLPAYRRIPDGVRTWLNELQMELYVPVRSQEEVIGVLALGPRLSGEPFRRNDLNLLSTLADQTVAGLKNAQMVQDMRRLNLDISQLNKELEAMNRTKTDFISIASHELRTPLAQVNGYAQMLDEELGKDSPLSVFVSGLLTGAVRLTEIVDVMLDVSRLDVGALNLKRTFLNIGDVVQRAAEEWDAAIKERGHTLAMDGLDGLPAIEADANRLQQAFSQLINNAIKYTPDGGCIEISGQVHSENNGVYVEVIVEDNGIGINWEDQHKIFDKFYRTGDLMKHSTGKTKFKGAGPGLGLSLVKGILDAHNGRVWVESPGHNEETCPGSTFHVLLPLHPPEYNPVMAQTMIHRRAPGEWSKP
jgi:signal transduction histidine kinase